MEGEAHALLAAELKEWIKSVQQLHIDQLVATLHDRLPPHETNRARLYRVLLYGRFSLEEIFQLIPTLTPLPTIRESEPDLNI